jgi:mono/diheme cytochrome c family protein
MRSNWTLGAALMLAVAIGSVPARAEDPAKPDGKALYAAKCGMCHGTDGAAKPMAKGSANFNDPAFQARATADDIANVILNGKGKMPKNAGKITPEQAQAIAAHVKTIPAAK